jgi:hypothetical protein
MSFHGPAALKNEPGVDVSMYPGRRQSVVLLALCCSCLWLEAKFRPQACVGRRHKGPHS